MLHIFELISASALPGFKAWPAGRRTMLAFKLATSLSIPSPVSSSGCCPPISESESLALIPRRRRRSAMSHRYGGAPVSGTVPQPGTVTVVTGTVTGRAVSVGGHGHGLQPARVHRPAVSGQAGQVMTPDFRATAAPAGAPTTAASERRRRIGGSGTAAPKGLLKSCAAVGSVLLEPQTPRLAGSVSSLRALTSPDVTLALLLRNACDSMGIHI